MTTPDNSGESKKHRRPPAKTPQARERRMISLAFDQAELQLREGVAPAPVVVHYLKLGTETAKLEQERLKLEMQLLQKKAEQIDQAARIEELYETAINAMTKYQGHADPEEYADYDD